MTKEQDRDTGGSRSRRARRLPALLALSLVMALLAPLTVQAESSNDELESLSALDEVELPPFVSIVGQQGKWTHFEAPTARVYGNGTQGFVAIAGGSIHDVCPDNPPQLATSRFRQHYDGSWEVRTLKGGAKVDVHLYKTDLEVFEFFGATCGAFFEDGVPLPEAFASGPVTLRTREWDIAAPFSFPQLPGRYKNSISGKVKAADGTEYRVRALADYEVDEAGELHFFRDILKVRKLGK